MKKLFMAMICLSVFGAASAQSKPQTVKTTETAVANPNAGKFEFKNETHDFGEVPEGPIVETDFEFKNIGKEPILITEAHGSCGCTVPEWPKEPIMPGKKAKIHVKYNTSGRAGAITKEVYITSNAVQSPMILHIRGTVKAKASAAADKAAH